MATERKNLLQLFIPISLETLCFMLTGMVDTVMLSSVGDKAVGAVGTANTYIGVFIIMFSIISSGMIAVMTQYIGAGKIGVAHQARQIGLAFNLILGVALSIFLFIFSGQILQVVGVAASLMEYADTYLKIVGSFCILNALIPIFSSYLRAFGYTKQPLYATLSANILNLLLNAFFLFVMNWGVAGVAIATVISRIINLLIVILSSKTLIHIDKNFEKVDNKLILKQIVKIGFPAALETALYNIAVTLTIRFLNQMDSEGLNVTARSYAMQIANFSYCVGASLAQANAILTGWRMGAKEFDECDKGTKKAAVIGIICASAISIIFALGAKQIMLIFSKDTTLIDLVAKLLIVDIFLELGRVTNLVFGQALKTSGDALFTTVIAAIFMYSCMVLGTYVLGIRLELLAVGAYIAMACDEIIRAVCMFLRWQSGKWRQKGIA